ncbi:MAG: PhnD/SsuA/transferrin family substrate-binding protein [Chloroflexi bacterium]|nr:PhnD/SsuA/transferrin family substrate-binding protein [Chloroflexota bacterium]
MKKLLLILALATLGCSIPVQLTFPAPTPSPVPTETPTPLPTPQTTAEPGTVENPLILALGPSPRTSEDALGAGETLAAQLEAQTGYKIVLASPTSEEDLIDDFARGNTHIAMLSPFGYLLARENGLVTAALASIRDEQTLYGTQIIANGRSEFKPFFDEISGENTTNTEEALSQFNDKKPCWSDVASPSGYVVPLGLLNQAQVQVRSGAFLEGQPNVVRAVYAADICDFGATFIDARELPALETDYPDVMEKVVVIWRVPPIIPYENISFSTTIPLEMRRVLLRAFMDLMLTPDGKAAIQTIYGIEAFQPVDDTLYTEFQKYVEASGLELEALLIQP